MEAEVALVASAVGVLVSGWLIRDAWRDRQTYLENDGYHHPVLNRITESRFVGEVVRGMIQGSFLVVAVIFAVEVNTRAIRNAGVWLLALIPVMIAGWSIYEWWGRKKILSDTQEDSGNVGR